MMIQMELRKFLIYIFRYHILTCLSSAPLDKDDKWVFFVFLFFGVPLFLFYLIFILFQDVSWGFSIQGSPFQCWNSSSKAG